MLKDPVVCVVSTKMSKDPSGFVSLFDSRSFKVATSGGVIVIPLYGTPGSGVPFSVSM